MHILLFRHGIAVDRNDPQAPADDEQRPLLPKGAKKTRAAARGLLALGFDPTVMISSPLVRAVQTADIVAEVLRVPPAARKTWNTLKPDADAADAARELSGMNATGVLVVGHAPQLDKLLAWLVGAPQPFTLLKKSGAVLLDAERVAKGGAELVWLMGPAELAALDDVE